MHLTILNLKCIFACFGFNNKIYVIDIHIILISILKDKYIVKSYIKNCYKNNGLFFLTINLMLIQTVIYWYKNICDLLL